MQCSSCDVSPCRASLVDVEHFRIKKIAGDGRCLFRALVRCEKNELKQSQFPNIELTRIALSYSGHFVYSILSKLNHMTLFRGFMIWYKTSRLKELLVVKASFCPRLQKKWKLVKKPMVN